MTLVIAVYNAEFLVLACAAHHQHRQHRQHHQHHRPTRGSREDRLWPCAAATGAAANEVYGAPTLTDVNTWLEVEGLNA